MSEHFLMPRSADGFMSCFYYTFPLPFFVVKYFFFFSFLNPLLKILEHEIKCKLCLCVAINFTRAYSSAQQERQ